MWERLLRTVQFRTALDRRELTGEEAVQIDLEVDLGRFHSAHGEEDHTVGYNTRQVVSLAC